ncbi:MAG: B3/4 domain-containing protein [Methylocystaceae bacterium]
MVSPRVFEVLDNYCIGVVAARGINNSQNLPEITHMLEQNIKTCEQQFEDKKVKEVPEIVCFREAFQKLGVNPNKFMSSIEALLTRISKKKGFPSINPLVDLGNAVSIKYHLPLGAHDLATVGDSLSVRFAEPGDYFIAFGETETEYPDSGELLYVSGHEIRTRRWIWRQSEIGKITEETNTVLFPIDGFSGVNKNEVLAARDELAGLLQSLFQCEVVSGFIDRQQPNFQIRF